MRLKRNHFPRRLVRVSLLLCLAMLSGCGGSGPLDDTPSVPGGTSGTATGSILLSFTKVSDNSPTTSISAESPARLNATVKDAAGRPIALKVIFFSTKSDLTFDPASGTALTDANGGASITVKAGKTTGAATINAEVTDDSGKAVSGSAGLSVATSNLRLSALTINPATISAGGSAGVTVTVMDGDGSPVVTSVPVLFTSNGVLAGKATITPQVNTVNGVASATYRDGHYGAVDTITATLSVGGSTLVKTGSITVNQAAAGAIAFVSATPETISLKGTGGAGRSETSVVVFKVLDTNGNAIQKRVNFSLAASTTVGGLSLTASSAYSDPETGLVRTIVNAGTVSTPVRVMATIDGTSIATTSDNLVVSTGVSAQNAFSVGASVLNIEGWSFDGVTTEVTVRLADHYNNPVPDGTAVNFRTTKGGSIKPSCMTWGGACKVQFTSQGVRPANGRVFVLAHVLGEESFTDLNGNGQYDPGIDRFIDLPEPFMDENENGARDPQEEFIDTNADGLYSLGDGLFNGILRSGSIIGPTTIHVRGSLTIVLSGSDADVTIDHLPVDQAGPIRFVRCPVGGEAKSPPGRYDLRVVDRNGNAMPAGTKITFSLERMTKTSTATETTIESENVTLQSTSEKPPLPFAVTMRNDALQGSARSIACSEGNSVGTITVKVETPQGYLSYRTVTITD